MAKKASALFVPLPSKKYIPSPPPQWLACPLTEFFIKRPVDVQIMPPTKFGCQAGRTLKVDVLSGLLIRTLHWSPNVSTYRCGTNTYLSLSPSFPFPLLSLSSNPPSPLLFPSSSPHFQMTSVSYWQFFLASALGLLPTQVLNTYMGSTVRSMQEVLTDRMDGYIILGVQVVFSLVLMLYLLNKARRELAKLTMQNREGEP